MPEQEQAQVKEVIRQEIHYTLGSKALIELRPLKPEDGGSIFVVKGGVTIGSQHAEFMRGVKGALSVEEAYARWDACFAEAVEEIKQKIAGRIVLPGPGSVGGNGSKPPFPGFGGGPRGRGVRG